MHWRQVARQFRNGILRLHSSCLCNRSISTTRGDIIHRCTQARIVRYKSPNVDKAQGGVTEDEGGRGCTVSEGIILTITSRSESQLTGMATYSTCINSIGFASGLEVVLIVVIGDFAAAGVVIVDIVVLGKTDCSVTIRFRTCIDSPTCSGRQRERHTIGHSRP